MTAILYATTNQAKRPSVIRLVLDTVASNWATELPGRSSSKSILVPMTPCPKISTLGPHATRDVSLPVSGQSAKLLRSDGTVGGEANRRQITRDAATSGTER